MSITINGKVYQSGENIRISNGNVIVDGNKISVNDKVIYFVIEGNIDKLNVDSCDKIYVNGDINQLESTSGDIVLNQALGIISTTSGNVRCEGDCGGSIGTTSGNVKINGKVLGSVKTMSGDIKHVPYEVPIIRSKPKHFYK